jgi:hypothetical protein
MIATGNRRWLAVLLVGVSLGALHGSAAAEELVIGEASGLTARPALTDEFGSSVAVDGDTAVAGAPGRYAGYVKVYRRLGKSWEQEATLFPDGVYGQGDFGASVALDGDTLLVSDRRLVYVFVYASGAWNQIVKLDPGYGVASVALDGDTAVIGSRGYGATGAAFVYQRLASTWEQGARLLPEDIARSNAFGHSVAIDGDTILVGDPIDNDSRLGSAHFFVRTSEGWSEQATVRAAEPYAGDMFGWSVALQEDTALIGATNYFSPGGAAWVFNRHGDAWTFAQKLTPSIAGSEAVGISVALDGDAALVGALDFCYGAYYGSAYLFTREDGDWVRRSRLVPRNGDCLRYDEVWFGWSVALDDGTAVVGAPYDVLGWGPGYDKGSALVFDLPVATVNLLVQRVEGLDLEHGIKQSLLSKLESALHIVGDDNPGNDGGAVPTLEAFIRQVEEHRGHGIETEDADTLVEGARGVIALIST